jgi:hypothetical protein
MEDTVAMSRKNNRKRINNQVPTPPAPIPGMSVEEYTTALNSSHRSLVRTLQTAFGVSMNEKRNLNKVYGWKDPAERDFDYYLDLYRYTSPGTRIIDMIVDSCWRDGFSIVPDEDSEEEIEADKLNVLAKRGLFTGLAAADRLNRIGQLSVMYIGLGDGKKPYEPVETRRIGEENIFFAPYSENSVAIPAYNQDPASGRWGLPERYDLTTNNTLTNDNTTDQRQSISAHWQRCVHFAEGALDNALNGRSALEPLANTIEDWHKVRGGAAEGFYRGARPKLTGDVDSENATMSAIANNSDQREKFQELLEQFNNDLLDYFGIPGAKVRAIPPMTADPSGVFKMIMHDLSMGSGIPQRILFGEGPGDRAGFQDKASYNQLINDRQKSFCNNLVVQTLSAFQTVGYLDLPEDYVIKWPAMEAMDELTIADVNNKDADTKLKETQAITLYAGAPGADDLVPPEVWAVEVMDLDPEDVDKVQDSGLEPME